MPTNYARGAAAERRAKLELEGVGYLVVRAAGSKGPVDLIALRAGQILLLQIKTGAARISRQDRQTLAAIPRPSCALVQVWTRIRRGWLKEVITSDVMA